MFEGSHISGHSCRCPVRPISDCADTVGRVLGRPMVYSVPRSKPCRNSRLLLLLFPHGIRGGPLRRRRRFPSAHPPPEPEPECESESRGRICSEDSISTDVLIRKDLSEIIEARRAER